MRHYSQQRGAGGICAYHTAARRVYRTAVADGTRAAAAAGRATDLAHAAEGGVPVVLDVVVGATGQVLSDLGPRVPVSLVHLDEDLLLLGRPFALLHLRVQVVQPPLPAPAAPRAVGQPGVGRTAPATLNCPSARGHFGSRARRLSGAAPRSIARAGTAGVAGGGALFAVAVGHVAGHHGPLDLVDALVPDQILELRVLICRPRPLAAVRRHAGACLAGPSTTPPEAAGGGTSPSPPKTLVNGDVCLLCTHLRKKTYPT